MASDKSGVIGGGWDEAWVVGAGAGGHGAGTGMTIGGTTTGPGVGGGGESATLRKFTPQFGQKSASGETDPPQLGQLPGVG